MSNYKAYHESKYREVPFKGLHLDVGVRGKAIEGKSPHEISYTTSASDREQRKTEFTTARNRDVPVKLMAFVRLM